MITLTKARRALLELQDDAQRHDDKHNLDRCIAIGQYLDAQVALNVESHTPGEKITAEEFHVLYGMRTKPAGRDLRFNTTGKFTVPVPEQRMTNVTLDGKRLTPEEANDVIRKFNAQGDGGGGNA